MSPLVDHPFVSGLMVSVGLMALIAVIPPAALSFGQLRDIAFICFGGTYAVLFRNGLRKDDAFWAFLGSACGILAALRFLR